MLWNGFAAFANSCEGDGFKKESQFFLTKNKAYKWSLKHKKVACQ